MNIYDVSKKAGVSTATVSRVINGYDNVSEKRREKVLVAMEELGYTPNVFARGLNLNSMRTVGIMCSDSSDTYLANAVYFLERELRKNGYDSFLCCTGYEAETKEKYFRLLLSKRVDAMILVGSSFLDLDERKNRYITDGSKKVPVMLMNGHLDRPNIYSIYSDDFNAVYDAAKNFIQSGRKRILFLYKTKSHNSLQKLDGYKKALQEADITVDDRLILQCPMQPDAIKKFIGSLYESGLVFDSIIASEDIMAVGAVKYAVSKGIDVPGQLSIIGFNNSLLAQCSDPEISSIDNKVEEVATTTVDCLMKVFAGEDVPKQTIIKTRLVRRQT